MGGSAGVSSTLHPVLAEALGRWHSAHPAPPSAARVLAEVIASDQVGVAYQPIVRLETGRRVGVEALVRIDPRRDPSFASASAVIALAEASGLIVPLGFAVLADAATQLARWRATPGGATWQVHVNVSPTQLIEAGAADDLERVILDHGVPPGAVVLEVTETVALDVGGRATSTLQTLESRGVELAIDDFGTGYASLDLLGAIPARTLKLDRSFVAAVGSDEIPRGRALVVEAAIGLGRSIGLRVVAEGVETERQAATLRAWGCHLAQGHLFGRAVPATALIPVRTDPSVHVHRRNGPARLPTGALELAAAAATLSLAAEAIDGAASQRVTLTHRLATSLTMERDRADTNLLLAALAAGEGPTIPLGRHSDAATSLAAVLTVTPDVSPEAPIGALASLATTVVAARRRGDARTAMLAGLAPLPTTAIAVIEQWWDGAPTERDPTELLRDAERRLRARDDGQHRVRSLLGMARVIGSSLDLLDVLEAAAQEARRVIGAATISISRFDFDRRELHTLINVGDLAPWEQVRPVDERYALDDYPQAVERMEARAVHVGSVEDPHGDPDEQELMARLGKGSWGAAPIIIDDRVWGELFAAIHVDEPAFTTADAPFLLAVSGLIGVAVARTEDLSRLDRLVHQDPLTGLANRRHLERHAATSLAGRRDGGGPTLAMIDVNGLKLHNDEFGHAAGDALLIAVAEVLRAGVAGRPGALAARIGGDEFCLVLPGDESAMRRLLDDVRRGLAAVPPPQPRLSIGVVVAGPDDHELDALLAQADSAQYDAKRTGAHLIVHGDRMLRSPSLLERPSGRVRQPIAPATALQRWVDSAGPGETFARRLEGIADAAMSLLDLNRWVISSIEDDGTLIIRHAHVRRSRADAAHSAPLADQIFHLDDFPLTARALALERSFVVDVNDPAADPQERELLDRDGQRYVIGVPVTEGRRRHLLELFGDDASVPPSLAVSLVDALVAHRPRAALHHVDDLGATATIALGTS
jgi:diguanylate cyclase (GGDEF)-like protein